MANSNAIISGQPFNPAVVWTPALQSTWLRMRAENHPLMVELFRATAAHDYVWTGEREMLCYHITGDEAYATTAFTQLFRDKFAPPPTGGATEPGANDTREGFAAKLIGYYWLKNWMSPAQLAEAQAYFRYWGDGRAGYKILNTSDSDTNTTALVMAALDFEFGTDYLSKTGSAGILIGNGGAIPRSDPLYFQKHLTPTGANNASIINELNFYLTVIGAGGLYAISSEYSVTEVILMLLSWMIIRDLLASVGEPDYFNCAAPFAARMKTTTAHQISPNHQGRAEWGDDENGGSLRAMQIMGWLAAAGCNDEVEAILAAGAPKTIYPRYFFFCNPYDPVPTPRPVVNWDPGAQILTAKLPSGEYFFTRCAPTNLYVDHRIPDFLEPKITAPGESWPCIGQPTLYGASDDSRLTTTFAGIRSMQNRTVLGVWSGDDWCAIKARTDGTYAADGGGTYGTPAYLNYNIKSLAFLPGGCVIREQISVIDHPRNLSNFTAYPSTSSWLSTVQADEAPSATSFVVYSAQQPIMKFAASGSIEYACEGITGANAGRVGFAVTKVSTNPSDPNNTKFRFTFDPGVFLTPSVGDQFKVRTVNRSYAWDRIVLSQSLTQFQLQCRSVPTVTGANSDTYTYTTPTRNVRCVRLSPATVDRVSVINQQSYTWPNGVTTNQGLAGSGLNATQYNTWPRRVSAQIDAPGPIELINVITHVSLAGTHPAVQNVPGLGVVVGNKLVLFGTDDIAVVDAVSPILFTLTINALGTKITCAYDAAVRGIGGGDPLPPTLNLSGGVVTATYESGSGDTELVFALSRPVERVETGTGGFAADSFELVADGVNNQTISGRQVTNTSQRDTTPPTAAPNGVVSDTGILFSQLFNEPVVVSGTGSIGLALTASGGPITATYLSGSNTPTLTWELSRPTVIGETLTRGITAGSIADAAGNLLASFSGRAVTNNSALNPAEALAPVVVGFSTGADLTPTGTLSLPVPAGTSTGRLLLPHVGVDTATISSAPAAMTQLRNSNISNVRGAVYSRVVGDGDSLSYDWTTGQFGGVNRASRGAIALVSNFDPAAAIVSAVATANSATTHTAPSVTTVAPNSRLMYFVAANIPSTINLATPAGLTLVYAHRSSGNAQSPALFLFRTSQASEGASSTVPFVFSSAASAVIQVVAVAPFVDRDPPTVTAAAATRNGRYVDFTFDKPVYGDGAIQPTGFLVSGGHALAYFTGIGTTTLRFAATPFVESDESDLTYTYAAGNVRDAVGNLLEDVDTTALANNSTYPIGVALEILPAGNLFRATADRPVSGWAAGQWAMSATGGAVSVTGIFEIGADYCTFTLDRKILASETVTPTAPEGYAVDADGVTTDAVALESVSNTSTQTAGVVGTVAVRVGSGHFVFRVPL